MDDHQEIPLSVLALRWGVGVLTALMTVLTLGSISSFISPTERSQVKSLQSEGVVSDSNPTSPPVVAVMESQPTALELQAGSQQREEDTQIRLAEIQAQIAREQRAEQQAFEKAKLERAHALEMERIEREIEMKQQLQAEAARYQMATGLLLQIGRRVQVAPQSDWQQEWEQERLNRQLNQRFDDLERQIRRHSY